MNNNTKFLLIWLVKVYACLFNAGMTILICYTWFGAFFNGDQITVTINDIGEKYPELALWILTAPILLYGTYLIMRKIWDDGWLQRKRLRKLIRGDEDATEWL